MFGSATKNVCEKRYHASKFAAYHALQDHELRRKLPLLAAADDEMLVVARAHETAAAIGAAVRTAPRLGHGRDLRDARCIVRVSRGAHVPIALAKAPALQCSTHDTGKIKDKLNIGYPRIVLENRLSQID